MDRHLTAALREYRKTGVGEQVVLAAIARSGGNRSSRWSQVDSGIRYAFIDQLDYGRVEYEDLAAGGYRGQEGYLMTVPGQTGDQTGVVIAAEDLEMERETQLAQHCFSVWRAYRRHSAYAVRIRAWFPSRRELLDSGEVLDVRMDASGPVREMPDVYETLYEVMPWATIVSAQVSQNKRPQRVLEVQPKEEAEWPAESKRVHVRG